MDETPIAREARAFEAVMACPDAASRSACLDRCCGADTEFRRRVEGLVAACTGGFFDAPFAANTPGTGRDALADPVGTVIGRYQLLERLGEGGCGVVYAAEQTEPVVRRVALKVVKPGMDTRVVLARFDAERQILGLMDHPGIAKVLDAGTTEAGRPYFVMELVRGTRITEYCDKVSMPLRPRLELFIQVCQAVQHAHQKAVIHRDLKPSNILVVFQEGSSSGPTAKVIDFGIAKALGGVSTDLTLYTHSGQFIGTPVYMSPEQADGSSLDIDTRSDVYSLGVVLYELLTGRTPFDPDELARRGLDEVRRMIRETLPARPSTRLDRLEPDAMSAVAGARETAADGLKAMLRGELDWVVMKCLEKDRTRRYATANGLAADVERFLANEPVVARPPSAGYLLSKFIARHRAVFAAGVLVFVLLVAVAVLSVRQAVVMARAEQTERRLREDAQSERTRALAAQRQAELLKARAERSEANARRLLYFARINLARQLWEQNDLTPLRALIRETRGLPDRNFEWHFWNRVTQQRERDFAGHPQGTTCGAFSPDAAALASGGNDGFVRVWNRADGTELLRLPSPSDPIWSVAWSPDGGRIAAGSDDGWIHVWEYPSGKKLYKARAHPSRVAGITFSMDGRSMATAGFDGNVRVSSSTDGALLREWKAHEGVIGSLDRSPDGGRLLTTSHDGSAKVWDLDGGRELAVLKAEGHAMLHGSFSPDGTEVATADVGGHLRRWDAAKGSLVAELAGHSDAVGGVAFTPDGTRLVSGGADRTVRVWSREKNRELFVLKGHAAFVGSLAVSRDGGWLATTGHDGQLKLWDLRQDDLLRLQQESSEIAVGGRCLHSLAFCPDNRTIIAASERGVAYVVDTASPANVRELAGHRSGLFSVAVSADGRLVATGSHDGTARLWNLEAGAELMQFDAHAGPVFGVALSADGKKTATVGEDGIARVWDSASGKELRRFTGHKGPVRSIVFLPDGRRVATAGSDRTVRVWNGDDGTELVQWGGHSGRWGGLVPGTDGQWIAGSGADGRIHLWDVADGRERLAVGGSGAPSNLVAVFPAGERILTAGFDHLAFVHETGTGEEVFRLKGDTDRFMSLAISPDGRRVATGTYDGRLRVWWAGDEK